MTTKTALLALLALWGVGGCVTLPAQAQQPASEHRAEHSPAKRSFTNRVWVRSDTDERPGVIRIFLSDGTLVQDSCWETHRLSPWHMTSATGLAWEEDGTEIAAEIVTVSAAELVLSLQLGGETVEERYTAAAVPFLCPDLPD
jgi:hypothetical protein